MKTMSKMAGAIMLCAGMMLSFPAYANDGYEENIAAVEAFKANVAKNIGHGKKVYFASPMFNHAEKDFNLKLTKVLEAHGYQVFLPQRDGIEAAKLEGKTEEELIEMIFALDATEVKKADIVFMNIDGRVPDEGACVELGMAYGTGKRCYGFKTDTHSVELGLDMNPMISGCMLKVFKNYDGDRLIEEIQQYLSENAL
jgi:nucleoside 2-deoxyribosyltransferase